MFKNVAAKFMVFAFDATTNVPKTGDAANITAYVSKDYGAVTVLGDTSATEMEATNAPGYYLFDAAQAETNADCLMVSAKSATANIKVLGAPAVIYTRPTTGWLAPATAGRTLVVDAAGLADANVVKVGPTAGGTAQTARDIGASVLLSAGTGTGQLDFTSGIVKANAVQLLGTAWLTPGTAGTPDVNVKLWNALATVELPLVPTTAGRKLDVSAGGEAGVDWANVGSPTTTLALTGTTIATTQKVDVETIKTNPVVNAGTITFPTTATLASTTNITAGTITTVGTLTTYTGNTVQTGDSFARIGVAGAGLTNIDLPNQTMDITGNITGNLSGSVGSVTGAVGSVTGAVASVTGNVGGNVTGTVGSVVGAVGSVTGNVGGNVVGSVASVVGAVGSVTGAVGSVTGNVGGNVAGSVASVTAGVTLAASGSATLTEGYRAPGAGGTLNQILYEILGLLGEKAVASTTLTTKKVDQVTPAATYTLDQVPNTTSITRAT